MLNRFLRLTIKYLIFSYFKRQRKYYRQICMILAIAESRYSLSISNPINEIPRRNAATAVEPMPTNGSMTSFVFALPCNMIHLSGSFTGKVAGCGRCLAPALYCFIRYEPNVASVASIFLSRLPATNVCLVLV